MSNRYSLHGVENQSVLDSESGIIIETGDSEDAELLRDQLNSYEDRLDAALAERGALKEELAARKDSFSMDRHIELMQAHEKALAELAEERAAADRLAEATRKFILTGETEMTLGRMREWIVALSDTQPDPDATKDTLALIDALSAHDARRQPATEGGENV